MMAFLHTFSIVAKDKTNGQMGVAVQSHWFAVGVMCPWVEAGVGAIATQSMVEVSYGPLGLEKLRNDQSAATTLAELLEKDEERELRQVAVLDARGNVAAHTGARCIAAAGHQIGDGFSVQANLMDNDNVWPSMARAFESAAGDLAERMLAALKAGQAAGGDIRGMQSACMLVVDGAKSDQPWNHTLVNLRVDDSPAPIEELERLLSIQRAYDLANAGDELLAKNNNPGAMDKYLQASILAPQIDEIPFWQAVALANSGNLEEALPIFKDIFKRNANWAELVQRLSASGLLKDDREMMAKILATHLNNRG